MRFLHTGDIHFGGSKYLPSYLERQEEAFDQIFDIAADRKVDVVVIAGDLFDENTPSSEARDLVERKLLQYDAAGYHILLIPGNHDLVDHSGYTALRYLSMLYTHGRLQNSVVTETTMYHQIGDTVFLLLAHRKGEFNDAARQAVTDYHSSSIQTGAKNLVVVAHETIRNSQTDIKMGDDSFYRLDSGEDPPDPDLPVTYWALGDIHKMQKVGPRAFYSGAFMQIKFGDDWLKGVLLVDTEDPDNSEFVPVITNQLVKAVIGSDVPENSYVKLLLTKKSQLLTEDLPSNVVKFDMDPASSTLSLDLTGTIKEKLIEGVVQQGATDEILAIATAEVESLLLSFQDA